jgi:hypothetical protein
VLAALETIKQIRSLEDKVQYEERRQEQLKLVEQEINSVSNVHAKRQQQQQQQQQFPPLPLVPSHDWH